MGNSSLFPKLAFQSIRNNRKFYLPYILALIGNVAAVYIMSALVSDPGVKDIAPGRPNAHMYVEAFMSIGMVIAFFFSFIFVNYINGFLMKQRKKELGLYNILGMGKRHIALVLVYETLYVGAAGILGGLAAGLVFHKLVNLCLHKVLFMPAPFGFYISWSGMILTAGMFSGMLLLVLLGNLNKVRLSKPIELLHSASAGEREPKTRWLMTLLGVLALGTGYYIAISTRTGVDALMLYFVAVFLVIVGTYCLFTAVSIFVLKALRRSKRFYYQTSHFIGVSGMLHRMKQNAMGLANICILCTMVMVMLSGTLSLYLGTEDIVREQYPGDVNVAVRYFPRPTADSGEDWTPFDPEAMLSLQTGFIESQGLAVTDVNTYTRFGFGAGLLKDGTYTTDRFAQDAAGAVVSITCITQEQYNKAAGDSLSLQDGEIAAYGVEGDEMTIRWVIPGEGREVDRSTLPIVRKLQSNPTQDPQIAQMVTIVVRDEAAVTALWEKQAAAYVDDWSALHWCAAIDVDGSEEALYRMQSRHMEAIEDSGFYNGTGSWYACSWNLRSDGAAESYAMAGGFLFLGIFLGFIFLMATVLMIYYKQVSEGYEDKARFEIMQKVGLSRSEVKRAIHSQILMVFFLPIAVAAIHIVFDFNMVEKLLTLLFLNNTALTALCTLGTVLVFFLVYGVVYLLTARTYYKIVER